MSPAVLWGAEKAWQDTSNFLCFIVCFFLQSAIPIHARRLSHNPPTSKKPHTNSDILSFTDFNLVRLRSWVSGGKQPRFVAQLLHLHVRCSAPCRNPTSSLFYKWKAVSRGGLRSVRPKFRNADVSENLTQPGAFCVEHKVLPRTLKERATQ